VSGAAVMESGTVDTSVAVAALGVFDVLGRGAVRAAILEDGALVRVSAIDAMAVWPMQYVTMLRRVAEIKGRPLLIVPVPLLSPGLSSHWLAFVTDVDTQTGRSLVDSMANEVIVNDDSIRSIVAFEPMVAITSGKVADPPLTVYVAVQLMNGCTPMRVYTSGPGPAVAA